MCTTAAIMYSCWLDSNIIKEPRPHWTGGAGDTPPGADRESDREADQTGDTSLWEELTAAPTRQGKGTDKHHMLYNW